MVVPRNLKKKGEGKWKRTCDIRFELYYEDMTKLKIKIRRIGKPTEEEEDFLSQRSCGQTIQEHYQQNQFQGSLGLTETETAITEPALVCAGFFADKL